MSDHPQAIGGTGSAPWESIGQVGPSALLSCDPDVYPAPWATFDRGNGHVDVIDAGGRRFAHVLAWTPVSREELTDIVEARAMDAMTARAAELDRPIFHGGPRPMSADDTAAMVAWSRVAGTLDWMRQRATLRRMKRDATGVDERKALEGAIWLMCERIEEMLRQTGRYVAPDGSR